MSATLDEFRETYDCAFSMVKLWEMLKNSLKWYLVPLVKTGGSSKRSRLVQARLSRARPQVHLMLVLK
ncbi:hypothetical protein Hanom_Chr15g01354661 [Helianthus anomalus]